VPTGRIYRGQQRGEMVMGLSDWLIFGGIVALVMAANVAAYKQKPLCKWCDVRHYGRCMWNPRAGKVFANVNDGHFDYYNPNE
jgi:hypothetical protein